MHMHHYTTLTWRQCSLAAVGTTGKWRLALRLVNAIDLTLSLSVLTLQTDKPMNTSVHWSLDLTGSLCQAVHRCVCVCTGVGWIRCICPGSSFLVQGLEVQMPSPSCRHGRQLSNCDAGRLHSSMRVH